MSSIFYKLRTSVRAINFIENSRLSINRCFSSEMRFVQFKDRDNRVKLGLTTTDGFIKDLTPIYSNSMVDFIASNPDIEDVKRKADSITSEYSKDEVELLPPVLNPEKILCIALNYKGHCDEQNKKYPTEPVFFSKFASTLVGPNGNIIAHKISEKIDWEVELAVIIGKKAKHVKKSNAFDHVFGYTVAQDISARDWQKQRNGGQFLIGKSMDTFCPLGPAIVHKSEVDPSDLKISCSLNGVKKQEGKTSELIFKIDDIIEQITKCITLKPGDVILTGTPSGVGMHRNPPEYLKPNDILESEIENIGKITNKIIADNYN